MKHCISVHLMQRTAEHGVWGPMRDGVTGGRTPHLGMLSRKSARWLIAGMTKLSTEQARLPMREMKKPKPGTNAAAAATHSTRAARQARNTAQRRCCGTFCRNQACARCGRESDEILRRSCLDAPSQSCHGAYAGA